MSHSDIFLKEYVISVFLNFYINFVTAEKGFGKNKTSLAIIRKKIELLDSKRCFKNNCPAYSYPVNRLPDKITTYRRLINPFEVWRSTHIWKKDINIASIKKLRAAKFRECMLPSGPESFVFPPSIYEHKD
jgi:hypothetical protein